MVYKAPSGKEYKLRVGSRAQVWHETAYKTRGNLVKSDLEKDSKTGRIMSKKRRALGRKAWANMKPETKKIFMEHAEKFRAKKKKKDAAAPAKKAEPAKPVKRKAAPKAAPAKKKKAEPAKKKKKAEPAKKKVEPAKKKAAPAKKKAAPPKKKKAAPAKKKKAAPAKKKAASKK